MTIHSGFPLCSLTASLENRSASLCNWRFALAGFPFFPKKKKEKASIKGELEGRAGEAGDTRKETELSSRRVTRQASQSSRDLFFMRNLRHCEKFAIIAVLQITSVISLGRF